MKTSTKLSLLSSLYTRALPRKQGMSLPDIGLQCQRGARDGHERLAHGEDISAFCPAAVAVRLRQRSPESRSQP